MNAEKSQQAHAEARHLAMQERRYVLDLPIPAGSGALILDPDGVAIAYVFTYREGWEERAQRMVAAANAGKEAADGRS